MENFICGIQQVGIGTPDLHRDWKWYRKAFGMDIRIFEDAAEAPLMTQYTGDKVQERLAVLAMNMQGGGGFEIWQYTSRESKPPSFSTDLGNYGFLAVKMKTKSVKKAYASYKKMGYKILTEPKENPAGQLHFYIEDPKGNWFNIVENATYFKKDKGITAGVYGMVVGVSDIGKSMHFYKNVLGFDKVLAEEKTVAADLEGLNGSEKKIHRVILEQSNAAKGPFNPLLGKNQIELVQTIEHTGKATFENRFWGDQGFIHLCFDVRDMTGLKEMAAKNKHSFTVDSANSFDMGKAAGRFGYIEDPDGALIEFVETHKLPIVEKWGLYLDLRKRKAGKSLPKWLINCFRFNRVKD